MSFPAYSEYKDSGVGWLGFVPAHWGQFALKRAVQLKSGETIGPDAIEETGDFPVFGGNGFRGYTSSYTHDGEYVLIGRQGALCGNINYATGKFWSSEHAVVATGKMPHATRWLGELLRTMNLGQYSVSAAQPGLSVEIISNLGIPFPPLSEQTAIATFLDRETAKIDALIAEQEKLITLLKEKRQAVISHAVTKGLNPDAPMKDSGVEWLGDVPAHWTIWQSRRLFLQRKERLLPDDQQLTASQKYGVIPQAEFMKLEDQKVMQVLTGSEILKHVEPNDFVISMRSFQGGIEWCGYRGCVSSAYVPLIPTSQIMPSYFRHLFKSQVYIQALQSTTNLVRDGQALRYDNFCLVPLPKPSDEEQVSIAAYVDAEVSKYDSLSAEAESAIALLQERRSALISAAVTGKIKVCDESVTREAA